MKIDVEGAEMLLLEGLGGYLRDRRIKSIICEVHSPVVNIDELIRYLQDCGYSVRSIGGAEIYAELG